MERLGILITELKDQFDQKADPDTLIQITGKINTLLQHFKYQPQTHGIISIAETAEDAIRSVDSAQENKMDATVITMLEEYPIYNVSREPVRIEKEEKLDMTPDTISENSQAKEVNEVIIQRKDSINDALKAEKTEIAAALNAIIVKDLKKAIAINDRFRFITELFRGDEIMFERSIKTINSFSIYPEAEYWIKRELKTKLGWKDQDKAVQLFDQLVKRRFS